MFGFLDDDLLWLLVGLAYRFLPNRDFALGIDQPEVGERVEPDAGEGFGAIFVLVFVACRALVDESVFLIVVSLVVLEGDVAFDEAADILRVRCKVDARVKLWRFY